MNSDLQIHYMKMCDQLKADVSYCDFLGAVHIASKNTWETSAMTCALHDKAEISAEDKLISSTETCLQYLCY